MTRETAELAAGAASLSAAGILLVLVRGFVGPRPAQALALLLLAAALLGSLFHP